MWFRPYFTSTGLDLDTSLPSATAVASARRRSFLAALSSGRYFISSLKIDLAVDESAARLNWLIGGGILRRFERMRRGRWRRT